MPFKNLIATVSLSNRLGETNILEVNLNELVQDHPTADLMTVLIQKYPGNSVKIINVNWRVEPLE